jgi:tRNA A-37 threonylcarbamoyl transferase component Bud32
LIFLFVFPDGRFTPSWTPPVAVLWLVVAIYMQLPIGIFAGDGREGAYFGVSMVFYLTGLVAQHQRVQRNPHAAHLQQRKWVLIGLVFSLIGYIISAVSGFIPALNQPAPTAPGLVIYWALVMLICMTLFQMMIPLTIGFSIMRYRLWEVDVIINRTAVYGALTALLVAAFMADLYVAQKILDRLLGGDQAPFALAISALVAGALFQPVRRRLQRYMDRRIFHISPPGTAGGTPTTGSFSGLISGVQLGPYEVQEPLGQGGMAIIYRGRHTTLNRPVAIKVLSARTMANDNMRLRFEREAQTVAALNHPNIVRVFDFGHYEGMPYMVMELIDGEDLATLIRDSGPLTLDLVGPVARDIASALDYAHAQGVIHRDVKPSNVLLQPDRASEEPRYRSILTDFGIAKIRTGQTGLTKTGTIGTLDYMAPEQIVSARAVDARADIYAFGAMLFQMLTGELPFKADNPGAIVLACLQQPAPDPRTINPDIPEPIALALLQALEKDPRARFATAGALASKLQE